MRVQGGVILAHHVQEELHPIAGLSERQPLPGFFCAARHYRRCLLDELPPKSFRSRHIQCDGMLMMKYSTKFME